VANWRGTWDSGTAYGVDDSVTYGGTFYVCTTANTGQTPGTGVDWVTADTFTGGTDGTASGTSSAFAPVRI